MGQPLVEGLTATALAILGGAVDEVDVSIVGVGTSAETADTSTSAIRGAGRAAGVASIGTGMR